MKIDKNSLKQAEKEVCVAALKQSGFNFSEAARKLNISRGKLRHVVGMSAPSYPNRNRTVENKTDFIIKLLGK